ncbi:MAG: succinate dehydrogenase cytochrome b subunit [Limisphaerales bacterium]
MKLLQRIFGSTLGKKYIMALTGLGMVFFVTGHMIGNLQLFLGPEVINRYAAFLQGLGELLWAVRFGLLGMIALHIWAALTLSVENKAARPVEYGHGKPAFGSSLASRTMLGGGVIVALFIVFHLLHYTVCVKAVNFTGIDFAHLEYTMKDGRVVHDVFAMIVYGFGVWYVSLFYLLSVGLLSLHLSHGIAAMCQSLGLRSHAWWPVISNGAKIWAVALFLGYAVIPLGVMAGFGKGHIQAVQATGGDARSATGVTAVTFGATASATQEAK